MSNNYKIGLIGCGAVGSSFLYSALNQGLGTKYVLIDAFPAAAQGNALDFADTAATVPTPFDYVKAGDYSDLSDADIVVITAGRPQIKKADGTLETRLEMVAGNSIIMKGIADSVKKSGFNGIVVIASNPVDVLTRIFQEESGFDSNKVIGSGTTLDSSRLRRLLGEKLDVNAQKIEADILGEHGDSSIAAWSNATVEGKSIFDFVKEGKISVEDLNSIHNDAVQMAYKIIELKKATYYGIGTALAKIVKAVLQDLNIQLIVGAKLNGEYGCTGVYTGVPAIIGKNGISKIIEWKLEPAELEKFQASSKTLENTYLSTKA